jgi:hypothetical protein
MVQLAEAAGRVEPLMSCRLPDPQLASLIARFVPGGGAAVCIGDGTRGLLADLGFDAEMLDPAGRVSVPTGLKLAVAWDLMWHADISGPAASVAGLAADFAICRWLTPFNSFCQAMLRPRPERPGVMSVAVAEDAEAPRRRVHHADACELPGYQRLALQTLRLTADGEVSEWHLTAHRRLW